MDRIHRGPLIPSLALGAGIAISCALGLHCWCGLIAIIPALLLYISIIKASRDPVRAYLLGKWHIVWVILLFFGIGLVDESLNRPESIEKAFCGMVPDSLRCEVTSVLTKTYGERIDVVLESTNGAKARIRSGVIEISAGDIIVIPSSCLKNIDSDTTEIGQRIRPMMKSAGIMYTGKLPPKSISIIGKSYSPRYIFREMREKIEIVIERSPLNKDTSGFLNAILLGDRTGLDEDTRLTFANGGMSHMLALSGLHIGILAGFIMLLLWPVRLSGHYKPAYAAAIIFLWIYVAVTGMAYSSVRACIMTTFAFIGIICERKNFAGNALCSATLLILAVDPYALFDVGFQLSVVCVGGLIAYSSGLNPIGHRNHPILFYISGSLIATMVATAVSWPLTAYYFSQVALMFLPSNLLLLPLLPFYFSLALVYIAFLALGMEMTWIGQSLDKGYDFLLESVRYLSGGAEFVMDCQIPLWGVALWMLLFASGAYAINRKRKI